MTHILIMSGSATGGPVPRTLELDMFQNVNTFYPVVLQYVAAHSLTLDRFVNPNTFYDVVLQPVVVTPLTATHHTNANTFYDLELVALPFVPVNAETSALLAAFTGTYSTTLKIQIDTFISALKDAGIWALLDWFSCARFAVNEHDSLLDWTNPARSLVNVGGVTFTALTGWQGVTPAIADARLKSGWNIGDGPHSTSTNFTAFAKIETIGASENGMQPFGVWRRVIGGGPSTPDGIFISLSILANTGFAGANVNSGEGNTSFAPGSGVGLWGIVRGGGTTKTFKDGVELESDAVATTSGYSHADGMSIAGSAGLAKRAFNGLQSYAGWGGAMTGAQLAGIEAAFQLALLPPSVVTDAWLIDGSDDYWIINGDDDYWKVP